MEQFNDTLAKIVKAILKAVRRIAIFMICISLPLFLVVCTASVVAVSIASTTIQDKDNGAKNKQDSYYADEGTAKETIAFAKKHLGKDLKYFLKVDNSGRFFGDHWCAMFCGYVLYNTNKESFASEKFSASCSAWNTALGDKLHLKNSKYIPKAGDLVFFGAGGSEHIGLLESYDKKTKKMVTIEGNTVHGPYPWGSIVGEHTFYFTSNDYYDNWIYGFGEVEYNQKSKNEVNGDFKDRGLSLPATGVPTKLSDAEKDVLMRSLYREAGGTSFECQVYTCSATLNLWEYSYSNWSLTQLLHTKNQFETSDTIDSVTESQKDYVREACEYVLAGGRVADIKYFRTDYYHDWGGTPTPVICVDNVYFSK